MDGWMERRFGREVCKQGLRAVVLRVTTGRKPKCSKTDTLQDSKKCIRYLDPMF